MRGSVLALGLALASARLQGEAPTYTPKEATRHVGETATVCGVMAGGRYLVGSWGSPTLLNMDEPYPHSPFTLVIWGDDRSKFD